MTEEFGSGVRVADRYRPRPQETRALGRNAAKWSVGFVAVLVIGAMLAALQVYQVTAEGPAKQTLRRSLAAITELDTLLERDYDAMQERTQAADDDEIVALTGYPIGIELTAGDVRGVSREDVRRLILERSAERMYSSGTDALRDPEEGQSAPGRFTAAGVVDRSLDLLRDGVHDAAGVATFLLAAFALALVATLAALSRGYGRIGSAGVVVLAASLPLLLAALAARAWMSISGDDGDFLEHELLEAGKAMVWIPVRNGIAFTLLGAAFVAVALLFDRLFGGSRAPEPGN
jgi:hypothetical protein